MPKSKEDYLAKHKAKMMHTKEHGSSPQAKPAKGGNAPGTPNAKKQ
jgi:hypothetical protein